MLGESQETFQLDKTIPIGGNANAEMLEEGMRPPQSQQFELDQTIEQMRGGQSDMPMQDEASVGDLAEEQAQREAEEERARMEAREKQLQQEAQIKTELENELAQRWREKQTEIFQFRALLSSRSNILVHGPNGSGKTSFVLDCVKVQSTIDNTFFVNVDCIEFYSERLLAICVSQHLNTLISKAAKKVSGKGKAMPISFRSRFTFKICKNIDALHEQLRQVQLTVERTKRQIAIQKLKKNDRDVDDEALLLQTIQTVSLGLLDNMFFYLVLDNVRALFKIEKQKHVIQKLSICQCHTMPTCFSIIVVNDALVKEIDVIGEGMNVFDEYMFTPYSFTPMSATQIERLMLDTLREIYLTDEQKANYAMDSRYLEIVFPDFFSMLYQFVSAYTVTVNEYAYLCIFLYPHYMEAVYQEANKLVHSGSNESHEQINANIQDLVDRRGLKLGDKKFRSLLQECLSNLYIHATSKEDILRNVEERRADEQVAEAQQNQKAAQKFNGGPGANKRDVDLFNYQEITYVKDMKKQINFSYMQSLALCAAYITGMNKESSDLRMFSRTAKSKLKNQKPKSAQPSNFVGKSKRFSLERFSAVLDYLVSTQAEESQENRIHGHSLEYYATINSLAGEGLLKKYVMKRSAVGDSSATGAAGAGEDLTSVAYKCNFDQNFVEDVAQKIGFLLTEYLVDGQTREE